MGRAADKKRFMGGGGLAGTVFIKKKRVKKVVYDYSLLEKINDSDNDLPQLSALFANERVRIQLIKYNTKIENDI